MDNNTRIFSDSVIQKEYRQSTPRQRVILIENCNRHENSSSEEFSSDSSTQQGFKKLVSYEEIIQFNEEIDSKILQYDMLVEHVTCELINFLKDYSLDSEPISPSEKYICDLSEKYSLKFLGEVLSSICLRCYGQPNVIAGVCCALERYDAKEVYPWGQCLVIGLINHKSDLVKERVISLVDNWADSTLISALRNINISSEWMREYLNDVISYLEDKLCIM